MLTVPALLSRPVEVAWPKGVSAEGLAAPRYHLGQIVSFTPQGLCRAARDFGMAHPAAEIRRIRFSLPQEEIERMVLRGGGAERGWAQAKDFAGWKNRYRLYPTIDITRSHLRWCCQRPPAEAGGLPGGTQATR